MKVVVTGASGLLGGNLASLLVERGHEVICIRRASTRAHHLGHLAPLVWRDAALSDTDALARVFTGADVVFHCAAMVSVRKGFTPEIEQANVAGTRHVAEAAARAGVGRLVHVSSSVAVGISADGRDLDESALWNLERMGLDDGYSLSKYLAENVIHEAVASGLSAVIVNPTYMLGPLDARPSSGKLILDVVRARVPGGTPGVNNFVDVRLVAAGILAAAERGRTGERYILGGENLSYMDLFRRIASVAGVRPPRFVVPRALATPLGWAGDLYERVSGREPLVNSATVRWGYCGGFRVSSAKAVRELGYQAGTRESLDQAIRDAITWFRAHRML